MSFFQNTSIPSGSSLESLIPPSLRPYLSLSYPISRSRALYGLSTHDHLRHTDQTLYDKGWDDVYFVAFCAVAFTILREIILRGVMKPFASYWLASSARKAKAKRKELKLKLNGSGGGTGNGTGSGSSSPRRETKREARQREHTALRFAEQGWSFVYCTVFWSLGMYILLQIPNPLSAKSIWAGYPHMYLPALTKFYYLAQLGWWFHQLYVIHSEKPRKDHWQMFSHHILSIFLITGSYYGNFTRIGTVVHVSMDFCDILLPLAKMFRYLSLTTLCDITFVIFLISWLFTRQCGLVFVLQSIYRGSPEYLSYSYNPSQGNYYSKNILALFGGLLGILLCLTTVWFYMACMVAVRVLRGLGAEDSRSDDEDEDEMETGSPLEDVPEIHTSTMASKFPTINGNSPRVNGVSHGLVGDESKKER